MEGGLILEVKRLSPTAVLPVRATPESAGYDLAAAAATVIPAHGRAVVQLDLAMAVPYGYYGRIAPRSGLAVKYSIDVGAGVVDSDYRGPVGVVLVNHGNEAFGVKVGDRIAQLVLERIGIAVVVDVLGDLSNTERGNGGFGSTGSGAASASK